jgi:multidrug efflux pump subunit AcrB
MEQSSTYLKRLRFPESLKNSFIARYLANPRLVLLLVSLVTLLGAFSYTQIQRTLNPEIKIPIVIVSTVLPGASPADIESLVTIPLEDAVAGVEDVKKVTSTSRDSVSVVSMEFESGVDPDKAQTDVQSAVESVTDLPEDAQTPRVQKLDFERTPVWTFAVTTREDTGSLMRFSDVLRDRIGDITTVESVSVNGFDEREIQVLIKPEAITTYGINPLSLSQLVKTSTAAFPAGNVFTTTSSLGLSVDPQSTNIEDLRNLKVNLNGTPVVLSDIATISENSKPDQAPSYYADSKTTPTRSLTFNVYKTGTASIDETVKEVHTVIDETQKEYNGQFSITSVLDAAEEVDHQFNELLRDFWITIGLIFFVLLIFLGIRQALIASLSIPLTFLVVFIIMNMTGITLSFIAFFSLLLALGLVVDDTIVVISAMTAYYRSGKFPPLETGLLVWRDFLIPVLTTTLTTVWAFVPLLLASGIIGEFIKPIPIIVSTALLGSIVIALLITIPLIIILLKPQLPGRVVIFLRILGVLLLMGLFYVLVPKSALLVPQLLVFGLVVALFVFLRSSLQEFFVGLLTRGKRSTRNTRTKNRAFSDILNHGLIRFEVISGFYKRLINQILASRGARRRTVFMVVIFSLFSYLLLPLGFVVNEFFPGGDQESMYVSLELPAGTNVRSTNQQTVPLLEELRRLPEVEYVTADVGQAFDAFGGASGGGSNQALVTINLKEDSERERSSIEVAQDIRTKYANYQNGTVTVAEVSGGPPAGAELQINLFGDDLRSLDEYADRIQKYLETKQGVNNVNKSIKPGTGKLVFEPNSNQLVENNLTLDSVGIWLRIFASGFSLDDVTFESEKRDVVFRMFGETPTPEQIGQISIPNQQGGNVPLSALGTISLKSNPTLITREDGKRTLSVTASVAEGYSVTQLNSDLEEYANLLNLPNGYFWRTGGVNEENQNSVNSILQAMILSFLLIVVTMVVQFSSFRKAIIVMLVIPLSISGVFIVFALTQTPLSFPALIGVLALFGIVVKNSILIVDQISQNLESGMNFVESIADGAASRMEAIALTSFASIFGLVPVTLSDPLWRGLGGAIIAGLSFSGIIMLFFIPVVYYMWYQGDVRKAKTSIAER